MEKWVKLSDLFPHRSVDVIVSRDLFGDGARSYFIATWCWDEEQWVIHFFGTPESEKGTSILIREYPVDSDEWMYIPEEKEIAIDTWPKDYVKHMDSDYEFNKIKSPYIVGDGERLAHSLINKEQEKSNKAEDQIVKQREIDLIECRIKE